MKTPVMGAYAILCSDGRAYVGGSVDIQKRLLGHRAHLRRGVHHSAKLQAAWRDLGEAAFSFAVLETVSSAAEILPTEQRWLDRLRADRELFNVYLTAGSPAGSKQSAELRLKRAIIQRGRGLSQESRDKVSASKRGKKHTAEARSKMSATRRADFRSAGMNHPQAMVTDDDVRAIRAMGEAGVTNVEMAVRFGISAAAVSKIKTRRNWAHVT